MIKSKVLLLFSLVFIGLSMTSCDDEPIDPALDPVNNIPTDACAAPVTFQASDFVGGSNVNLSWAAAPGTSAWQVQYGIEGFAVGSGTQITATDDQLSISGLTASNEYEFYIRTICGAESYSSWVGPINVGETIGTCPQPTGLTAVRAASNTVITASWTAVGTATTWEVQYGPAGFALSSGTIVPAASNSKSITGLSATTAYDFYVRSNCSATDDSSWTGPFTVAAVGGPGPGPVTYEFLSANVAGTQYNNLKPYFYPITGTEAQLVTLSDDQGRVLWIQGNSTPTATTPNGIEFNIRIHENFWTPSGAHDLISNDAVVWPGISINYIDLSNDAPLFTSETELPGTITVLEFNSVTKRIRGTFSFTFMKSNDDGETGPFSVTSGTFDFPVPAEAF